MSSIDPTKVMNLKKSTIEGVKENNFLDYAGIIPKIKIPTKSKNTAKDAICGLQLKFTNELFRDKANDANEGKERLLSVEYSCKKVVDTLEASPEKTLIEQENVMTPSTDVFQPWFEISSLKREKLLLQDALKHLNGIFENEKESWKAELDKSLILLKKSYAEILELKEMSKQAKQENLKLAQEKASLVCDNEKTNNQVKELEKSLDHMKFEMKEQKKIHDQDLFRDNIRASKRIGDLTKELETCKQEKKNKSVEGLILDNEKKSDKIEQMQKKMDKNGVYYEEQARALKECSKNNEELREKVQILQNDVSRKDELHDKTIKSLYLTIERAQLEKQAFQIDLQKAQEKYKQEKLNDGKKEREMNKSLEESATLLEELMCLKNERIKFLATADKLGIDQILGIDRKHGDICETLNQLITIINCMEKENSHLMLSQQMIRKEERKAEEMDTGLVKIVQRGRKSLTKVDKRKIQYISIQNEALIKEVEILKTNAREKTELFEKEKECMSLTIKRLKKEKFELFEDLESEQKKVEEFEKKGLHDVEALDKILKSENKELTIKLNQAEKELKSRKEKSIIDQSSPSILYDINNAESSQYSPSDFISSMTNANRSLPSTLCKEDARNFKKEIKCASPDNRHSGSYKQEIKSETNVRCPAKNDEKNDYGHNDEDDSQRFSYDDNYDKMDEIMEF